MTFKFHDILVARDYEVTQDRNTETKTTWSKVGRAWPTKSGEALNFELFLIPGTRYFIQLKDQSENKSTEEVPF